MREAFLQRLIADGRDVGCSPDELDGLDLVLGEAAVGNDAADNRFNGEIEVALSSDESQVLMLFMMNSIDKGEFERRRLDDGEGDPWQAQLRRQTLRGLGIDSCMDDMPVSRWQENYMKGASVASRADRGKNRGKGEGHRQTRHGRLGLYLQRKRGTRICRSQWLQEGQRFGDLSMDGGSGPCRVKWGLRPCWKDGSPKAELRMAAWAPAADMPYRSVEMVDMRLSTSTCICLWRGYS